MRARRIASCLRCIGWSLLSLLFVGCATGGSVSRPLTLAPVPVDGIGVTSMKLVRAGRDVQLVMSKTRAAATQYETALSTLVLRPRLGSVRLLTAVSQRLPPPPAWDLVREAHGDRVVLIHEVALGATSALRLIGWDGAEHPVPAGFDFVSYTSPRLVRAADPSRRVVAIADDRHAVLFERDDTGAYRRKSTLCECDGVQLVPSPDGEGFVLVYRVRSPGPVRGNTIAPGELYWQSLDRDLAAVAPVQPLFAGQTIFELAVDTDSKGIAILVNTREGTKLAFARSAAGPWRLLTFDEPANGETLSLPQVLLSPGRADVAFLDRAGAPDARLLASSVPTGGLR